MDVANAKITDEDWQECQRISELRTTPEGTSTLEENFDEAYKKIPTNMPPHEKVNAARKLFTRIVNNYISGNKPDIYAPHNVNDTVLSNKFEDFVDILHMKPREKCFLADQLFFESEKRPLRENEYNSLPPMLQKFFKQTDNGMYVRISEQVQRLVGAGRSRRRRSRKVSRRSKSNRSRRSKRV